MKSLFLFLASSFSLFAGEMVSIPAGSFKMGSDKGKANERPVHRVSLSSFKIDKYEVSNREYEKCVKSGRCTPAHYKNGRCTVWSKGTLRKTKMKNPDYIAPDKPVVCVSWVQARTYCRAQGKRLPTEAEWEYVATNAGRQEYSTSGTKTLQRKKPDAVTANSAGAYGVHNMNGNVSEWVNDRYEADYYKYSAKKNPKGPSVSRFRSIRGGGWYSNKSQSRSKRRHWFAPEAGEVSIGIRCAK